MFQFLVENCKVSTESVCVNDKSRSASFRAEIFTKILTVFICITMILPCAIKCILVNLGILSNSGDLVGALDAENH